MAKRKNYPEEFKRDAVDLVRSSTDRSLTDIAHSLGIQLETLRKVASVMMLVPFSLPRVVPGRTCPQSTTSAPRSSAIAASS
ncbi:transposase [Streptomyces sp. NPDC001984]